MGKKYWASEGIDKIGSKILGQFEDYQQFIASNGLLSTWRKSYDTYYKPLWMAGATQKAGKQGEYTITCINHYKNLLEHLLTMVTQNRPALDPKATNTDQKSQSQTILSRGLLDYYFKEKTLEEHYVLGLDYAIKMGEGFIIKEWDAKEGEIVFEDPDTNETQNEGDLVFSSAMSVDVARDCSVRDINKNKWWIVQRYENKFDMAERYPELAEKIIGLGNDASDNIYDLRSSMLDAYNSDIVPVYRLYHSRTPSLPEGRITECLREDIVTIDGPMPYKTNPVKRIIPKQIDRMNFGYSVAFDLLPLQEQSDVMHSIVTTNQRTLGVQNLQAPHGSNVSVEELKEGLNLLTFDPKLGKLEPLILLSTPVEIFNYIKDLSVLMETISGVNSVARGNPEASLKSASGSAMALVQSMAIQFANKLEQSATKVLEEIGTDIINDLRLFQKNERTAAIVGKSNQVYMSDYTADDFDLINRVTVDRGSALSKTVAGKLQIGQDLFEKGLIKTADQYFQILATGRLEVAIEGAEAEMLNIKSENEKLSEGIQVPVIVTDNHLMHINEHKAVVAPPESRNNPAVLKETLQHIQSHINELSNPMNVNILTLLGQQPIQAPQMPMPPNGNVPPPQDQMGQAPDMNVNPIIEKAENVNMPSPPTNPLTGEKAMLPQ